jgi:hypothetical protein
MAGSNPLEKSGLAQFFQDSVDPDRSFHIAAFFYVVDLMAVIDNEADTAVSPGGAADGYGGFLEIPGHP